MTTARARGCLVLALGSVGLFALLQTAPAQTGDKFMPTSDAANVPLILQYKPRLDGVDYSKVTPEEQKACTIKTIAMEKGNKGCGYVLFDPQGRPLRRLFGKDGVSIEVISYYKDGAEVYREQGPDLNKRPPSQFRWLNGGGSKWGVDSNEDGRIDAWRAISAEEAAHEAFLAVVTKDFARLRTLFVSEEELRGLRLPEAQAARIRDNMAKAQHKLAELLKTPALNNQPSYIGVDSSVPNCVPANLVVGPAQDILRYPSRAIHYQSAGKTEWLHTGEMILVGQAWRLTDVPTVSDIIEPGAGPTGTPIGNAAKTDPVVDKLLKDLLELDKTQPAFSGLGKDAKVVSYTQSRVMLLEQIYSKSTDAKEKEMWMKQILDNLLTGHQANKGDNSLLVKLGAYKNQLAQTSLASYAYYREMWARFAFPLHDGADAKTMKDWTVELEKFVQTFNKSDDAPDALWHLALNSEFGGPDKQTEAKRYYALIAKDFPEHPLAGKAAGAVRRLSLTGNAMQLASPTLDGRNFDLASLKGKVVVVYYWASNCNACIGDVARIRQMHSTLGAKGFEVVSVSLDDTPAAAMGFLKSNQLPGTHLFQATEQARGLEGPLAIQFGIVTVPTIMLVGRDGRVIDHSLQINELEDALKKAM